MRVFEFKQDGETMAVAAPDEHQAIDFFKKEMAKEPFFVMEIPEEDWNNKIIAADEDSDELLCINDIIDKTSEPYFIYGTIEF